MVEPYWTDRDPDIALYCGDNRIIMPELETESVDSIVTDPPYELGFMGKGWDRSGIAYDVNVWRECLRVLKPGGHLLAFGGSRTYHRLACAIEDAGFEIRDQIQWIYGSGFPKSLDVSKAIDKMRNDGTDFVLRCTVWIADRCDALGLTRGDLDRATGTSDMGGWWASRLAHRCVIPTLEQWRKLEPLLGEPPDWMKPALLPAFRPGDNWFQREQIGFHEAPAKSIYSQTAKPMSPDVPISLAATDEAKQWEGWGTALKPAHEPIVLARKPLRTSAVYVVSNVEAELFRRGVKEIRWKKENASGVERCVNRQNSSSTRPQPAGGTFADLADELETLPAAPRTANGSDPTMQIGDPKTPSTCGPTSSKGANNYETRSLQPTAESANAVTNPSEPFSRLIISTEAGPHIESQSTEKSTNNSNETDSLTAIESFAGIATGLTGLWETVHIKQDQNGFFMWPNGLPEIVPSKTPTVAENVLQHGTGGLNIDGCRIEARNGDDYGRSAANAQGTIHAHDGFEGKSFKIAERDAEYASPLGRWPSNLIHDGSDEVLAGFPETAVGALSGSQNDTRTDGKRNGWGLGGWDGPTVYKANSGSAARFFYCAKADKADRTEGLEAMPERVTSVGDERTSGQMNQRLHGLENRKTLTSTNHHPTVKPTDLMRYLCRLITPPKGLVLDPFCGSGSTGKAARAEGFRFIGIEINEEYCALAAARCEIQQRSLFGE